MVLGEQNRFPLSAISSQLVVGWFGFVLSHPFDQSVEWMSIGTG
jgi:hypothetical protein